MVYHESDGTILNRVGLLVVCRCGHIYEWLYDSEFQYCPVCGNEFYDQILEDIYEEATNENSEEAAGAGEAGGTEALG